jgi:hypothetical protein
MENITADFIIEKLNKIEDDEDDKYVLKKWTLEEQKKLLDIYYIISKKEEYIFKLIYEYHGCDSWEDIFRDYSKNYLVDKARGVKIAINELLENSDDNSD